MQSGVQVAFIKFTSQQTSCAQCKDIAEPWVDFGEANEDDKTILLGSVDCDEVESSPLCTRFEINDIYPTFLHFFPPSKDGDAFLGKPTKGEIRRFIRKLKEQCYPTRKDECTEEQLTEQAEMDKEGKKVLKEKVTASKAQLKLMKKRVDDAFRAYKEAEGDPSNPPTRKEKLELETMNRQQTLNMVNDVETDKYLQRKVWLTQHGGVGELFSDSAGAGSILGIRLPDKKAKQKPVAKEKKQPGPWAPDKKPKKKKAKAEEAGEEAEEAVPKDEM